MFCFMDLLNSPCDNQNFKHSSTQMVLEHTFGEVIWNTADKSLGRCSLHDI